MNEMPLWMGLTSHKGKRLYILRLQTIQVIENFAIRIIITIIEIIIIRKQLLLIVINNNKCFRLSGILNWL